VEKLSAQMFDLPCDLAYKRSGSGQPLVISTFPLGGIKVFETFAPTARTTLRQPERREESGRRYFCLSLRHGVKETISQSIA
jgi:hypothetical protein